MKHVSDLRSKTLCGLKNNDLPRGHTSLAALTDETKAMVNCPICKEQLKRSF